MYESIGATSLARSTCALSLLLLGVWGNRYARGADVPRPWMTKDSIAVRYLGLGEWGDTNVQQVVPSSDGRLAAFVLRSGDLTCDCNLNRIVVYDIQRVRDYLKEDAGDPDEARKKPAPVADATFRSRSPSNWGVLEMKWDPATGDLLFLGSSTDRTQAIYRLRVPAGRIERVTPDDENVRSFGFVSDTITYFVTQPRDAVYSAYPAIPVPRNEAGEISAFASGRTFIGENFVISKGKEPWKVESHELGSLPYRSGSMWVSPNGRYAMVLRPETSGGARSGVKEAATNGTRQSDEAIGYSVVDIRRRTIRPIFQTPVRIGPFMVRTGVPREAPLAQVLWSDNGAYAIIVNTLLPDPSGQGLRQRESKTAWVVGYSVRDGSWQPIEPIERGSESKTENEQATRVASVGWIVPGRKLLVRHEKAGVLTSNSVFEIKGDSWVRADDDSGSVPGATLERQPNRDVSIFVRQSQNEPPAVIASLGNRELALTEPDPSMAGVWRAPVVPFEWQAKDGRHLAGGLLLPRSDPGGRPFPLVIQPYTYNPSLFLPDGPHPTAYAAQALVAQGIAVLEVSMDRDSMGTTSEGPAFVEMIDSAAESLAADHEIDPSRVGVVGFSRAGFEVLYAISNPGRIRIAASESADNWSGNFAAYLNSSLTSTSPMADQERVYGGPFWMDRSFWLAHEPTFNANRVETPALFTEHGRMYAPASDAVAQGSAPASIDAVTTMGAFQLNHRPIEFLFFPEAEHLLRRPRERAASLEATVDWMAFWLQGHEDPSVDKRPQYERWREMRRADDQRKAGEKR